MNQNWYHELPEMYDQNRPSQQTLDELFAVQEIMQDTWFRSKSRREARQANCRWKLNAVRGTRNEQIRSRYSKAKYELAKLIQSCNVAAMTN